MVHVINGTIKHEILLMQIELCYHYKYILMFIYSISHNNYTGEHPQAMQKSGSFKFHQLNKCYIIAFMFLTSFFIKFNLQCRIATTILL